MQRTDPWLSTGLFFTALATLLVELLDARLLSVLTWYHVSFLAISVAMLGMAAGAILVFLSGVEGERARTLLWRASGGLALAVPATHVLLVRMRIPPIETLDAAALWPVAQATLLLTVPFVISGVVVTLALTRVGGRVGVLYGFDLLGAALGCLLLVPLLAALDMVSALVLSAGLAACGSFCFARVAGVRSSPFAALALLLVAASLVHAGIGHPIDLGYARGRPIEREQIERTAWNAHSHVWIAKAQRNVAPFFWARGKSPADLSATSAWVLIDGDAGTVITQWDGDPASLDWVRYDVTSLPYHLRSGDVGIVGVGGGRDVLAALWSGARSITAVELNDVLIDMLTGSHRRFAGIADRPEVSLVHDEARSYFTRSEERFDVLQMSLVDTWAATGAGAFTLSENALYTRDAWRVFLDRLQPDGILSTSRWFSPFDVSEASRLLALGVAALLDRGVERPVDHLALVVRGKVATLLVSPSPFSPEDLATLSAVVDRYRFRILAAPDQPPKSRQLQRIVSSGSEEALRTATDHPHYDFSPPSDERPYFFNMLKLASFHRIGELPRAEVTTGEGGVIWGNIRATVMLIALLLVCGALVVLIIFVPLLWTGPPAMRPASFLRAFLYFATIGYGFMSIQIPLLQRFSVYLGHPVYSYSVILFTMILFAGIGSLLSERVPLAGRRWHQVVPVSIAGMVLLLLLVVRPVLDATLGWQLVSRCAVVVAITAPLSTLLGFCFPFGLRMVEEISSDAAPWMWGVNGAFGVLASILAVLVSMAFGIQVNLAIAGAAYLLLAWPAGGLAREAFAGVTSQVPTDEDDAS